MQTHVIETIGLTRRYGAKVSVDQVALQVPQGEIYGFLGPNGAGKTTTIRMLLGLIRPTAGKVKLFGQELLTQRRSLLRKVGSLVESPSYYGHLTGYENLRVLATILKVSKQRIEQVLEMVRLDRDAHRKVKEYSLGMKQRLGIASALIGQPELLILDEPTNGLDPAGIQEIREMIRELPRKYGISVLVSSHLLSEIEQMATHVGIISQGKLIFQDQMGSLRQMNQTHTAIQLDQPEAGCKQLIKQGWSVYVQQGKLCADTTNPQEVAALVEALVLSKFAIYQVREQKKSLEDIFIELTGKEQSL